ncbi:MAG: hypothetical protein JNL60_18620 [Bacteroidia bacterium]|nr:hypothetical protein [Bacteroidia bacterium]
MKNKLCLIFFLLLSSFLNSQNYVDILKIHTNTTPLNPFDSGNAKTRVKELCVDLNVPIKLNERTAILSGLNYEAFQVRLFPEHGIASFGSASLKMGLNQRLSARLYGTFMFLPKYASDFNSVGQKDFQFGGLGFLKFVRHENLNFKAGLYYNSELFGPFFVPMLGFYYSSPNKKCEANLMLPLLADFNYRICPDINIGANFNGQIRSYHLNSSVPGHEDSYVQRSTNEIYLYIKFGITKNFSLFAKIGQSFGRSYRVYDQGDKVSMALPATFLGSKRKQLNSDFSDGYVFQLTLLYRVSLRK